MTSFSQEIETAGRELRSTLGGNDARLAKALTLIALSLGYGVVHSPERQRAGRGIVRRVGRLRRRACSVARA